MSILLKGLGEADVPVLVDDLPKKSRKKPVNTTNILHSAADPDWITNPEILAIERAMYAALGQSEIDLDVFSCETANLVVKAKKIWTMSDDGFKQPWDCDAGHCNHPGGTTVEAWHKLVDEWRAGRCRRMTWIGFSVEQLCILADPEKPGSYPHPMDFSTVYLRRRIPFLRESDVLDPANRGPSRPAHGNYATFVGIPTSVVDRFWAPLGRVFHGEFATA